MDAKKAANTTEKKDKRDRVRSPEELDVYIRVVRPGTVLLIGAFTLIVVALVVWGVTGSLPVTVSAKGVLYSEYHRLVSQATREDRLEELNEEVANLSEDQRSILEQMEVYCFLNAYQYSREELVDKPITVSYPGKQPVRGKVKAVYAVPYTKNMISEDFGTTFIADTCATSDYSWVVEVETDEPVASTTYTLMDVSIETGHVKPISMLFQ